MENSIRKFLSDYNANSPDNQSQQGSKMFIPDLLHNSISQQLIRPMSNNHIETEENEEKRGLFTESEIKEAFDTLANENGTFITREDLDFFLTELKVDTPDKVKEEMIRICAKETNDFVQFEEFLKMVIGEHFNKNIMDIKKKTKKKKSFFDEKNPNNNEIICQFILENKIYADKLLEIAENFKYIKENLFESCDYLNWIKWFDIKDNETNLKTYNHYAEWIHNKTMNFRNFFIIVVSLQYLRLQERFLLCFKVFDIENTGFISVSDMIRLINVFYNLKNEEIIEKKLRAILRKNKFKEEMITKEYFFKLFNDHIDLFLN